MAHTVHGVKCNTHDIVVVHGLRESGNARRHLLRAYFAVRDDREHRRGSSVVDNQHSMLQRRHHVQTLFGPDAPLPTSFVRLGL